MTDTEWEDAEVDRAPICPTCGVTSLPASPTPVIDTAFVCANDDCADYGEVVG